MRVLVCGGRTFRDHDWLYAGLNLIHSMQPITEIIEGGAPGADTLAANWAHWKKVKLTTVRAKWDTYSRGLHHGQKNPAGMIRNNLMAAMEPDIVVAAPGGTGTEHMVGLAKRRGLRVVRLEKMPVVRTRDGPLAYDQGAPPVRA